MVIYIFMIREASDDRHLFALSRPHNLRNLNHNNGTNDDDDVKKNTKVNERTTR
jgi:hypothetical protein